jgi:uncharacterized membrane protein YhaH (DUF805 family)
MSMLGLDGERNDTAEVEGGHSRESNWFSPRGRISRSQFGWRLLFVFGLLAIVAGVEIQSYDDYGHASYAETILPEFLLVFYVLSVGAAKRFHDLGLSGWLGLLAIVVWIPMIWSVWLGLLNLVIWIPLLLIRGRAERNNG